MDDSGQEAVRIECLPALPRHRVVAVYCFDTRSTLFPDEFLFSHEVDGSGGEGSKVLIVPPGKPVTPLATCNNWAAVMRADDTAALISAIVALPAPHVIVIDPAMPLPTRFLSALISRGLETADVTVLMYRYLKVGVIPEAPLAAHVSFFSPGVPGGMAIIQALWGPADWPTAADTVSRIYSELCEKGLWFVLVLPSRPAAPGPRWPTIHWHQTSPAIGDEKIATLHRSLGELLCGL